MSGLHKSLDSDVLNKIRMVRQMLSSRVSPHLFIGIMLSLLYIKKQHFFKTICEETGSSPDIYRFYRYCYPLSIDDPLLSIVNKFTEREMRSIDSTIFNKIIDIFNSLELSTSDYVLVANTLLEDSLNGIGERECGMFISPIEFGELIDNVLPKSTKTIFNPFAGLMSFAAAIKKYDKYVGVEIDPYICDLAKLYVALTDVEHKTQINLGDVGSYRIGEYDAIIANPPLKNKIRVWGNSLFQNEDFIESDVFVLRVFEQCTTQCGFAATFVPSSVLFSDRLEMSRLRQEIVRKNYLDSVIFLPSGILPGTNISFACVILKKDRVQNAPIMMVDASNYFKCEDRKKRLDVNAIVKAYMQEVSGASKLVSVDEINEKNIWLPSLYLISKQAAYLEGYQNYLWDEIVTESTYERFETRHAKGYVLGNKDLAEDWYNCMIEHSKLQESSNLNGYKKLVNDAILISKIGQLRPSVINASIENPVYISHNIVAYVPKIRLSLQYCCMILSTMEANSSVRVPTFYTMLKLGGEKLLLPDYEKQMIIYNEARNATLMERARKIGLQDVIEKMKREYMNEVRMRKHDMIPYTRELASIRRRMLKIIDSNNSIEELKHVFSDKLEKFDVALKHLTELLEELCNEESFGEAELINLDDYFYHLEVEHDDDYGYDITCDIDDKALEEYGLPFHEVSQNIKDACDGKMSFIEAMKKDLEKKDIIPLYAKISPNDFERLINNIIGNAVKHSFVGMNKEECLIEITLTVDAEKDKFKIKIFNSGKPFPKGLDKVRYGTLGEKAGETCGTGMGGHIVKRIVEHYGGDYDIYNQGNHPVVIIWLPIANTIENETV